MHKFILNYKENLFYFSFIFLKFKILKHFSFWLLIIITASFYQTCLKNYVFLWYFTYVMKLLSIVWIWKVRSWLKKLAENVIRS